MNATQDRVSKGQNAVKVTDSIERAANRGGLMLAATLAKRTAIMHDTKPNAWECATGAARLIQLAKRLDRHNVNQCNRETTARENSGALRAANEIIALAGTFGASVYLGGDPRGVAVRLYWPDMIPAGQSADSFTDRMLAVHV